MMKSLGDRLMKQAWRVGILAVACSAAAGASPAGAQLASSSVDVPAGEAALGTVNLPRAVTADGQTLPAGDYEVRLTARSASPAAAGALAVLERWVEFSQGGEVKGREVATLVPGAEIGEVAQVAAPGPGSPRVELLRENEYLRVWIHQDGTHYLIHLPVG